MSHLANDEPVGLVGAGTIGGGWAATYLARRRRCWWPIRHPPRSGG